MLLQREVATPGEVDEALALQARRGGDLATNLIEAAHPAEAALLAVLSEFHVIAALPAGLVPDASDAALSLLPRDFALRHNVMPWRTAGGVLELVCGEPLSSATLEELQRRLGLRIVQHLALAARVRVAVSSAFGLPADLRAQRVVARLAQPSEPPHPGTLSIPSVAPAKRTATLSERVLSLALSDPEVTSQQARRKGPFTVSMATEALDAATSHGAVLHVLFDFARQFFDYAVLFILRGELAEGVDAFGSGADRERVRGLGVPLDLPSVLSAARDKRSFELRPLAPEGVDASLRRDLNRTVSRAVIVLPVLVGVRVVALIYGDDGDTDVDIQQAGDALALMPLGSAALEKLILRRKLSGQGSIPSPAPDATVGDVLRRYKSEPRPRPMSSAPGVVALLGSNAEVALVVPSRLASFAAPAAKASSVPSAPAAPEVSVSEAEMDDDVALAVMNEHEQAAKRVVVAEVRGSVNERATSVQTGLVVQGPTLPPKGLSPSDVGLPQVMFDLRSVVAEHLDALGSESLSREEALRVRDDLLRSPELTAQVLADRFPGPTRVTPDPTRSLLPAVSDCGPLLSLAVKLGRRFAPALEALGRAPDSNTRFWSVLTSSEIGGPAAAEAALRALFDDDDRVRLAARACLRAAAGRKAWAAQARDRVRRIAEGLSEPMERRVIAIESLGDLRDRSTALLLIELLGTDSPELKAAVHRALQGLARRELPDIASQWRTWWERNVGHDRVEWLIDALAQEDEPHRTAAFEELQELAEDDFGYAPKLTTQQCAEVAARFRAWWEKEGRPRLTDPPGRAG